MSWGLVLSGGAAYGLANAGVLEVLEEEHIKPDYIAGSSMGAIVASLCALGHSTAELRALTDDMKMNNVAKFSDKFFKEGLHGGFFRQRLEEHLYKIIGDACIGDCKTPFVCVAGKIKQPIKWQRIIKEGFAKHVMESVELHIFDDDTRIIDALMASSAIPVVFSPHEIDGAQYVDLCHFGPIPARSLQNIHHPDCIVATDTNPTYDTLEKMMPPSWKEFLQAGSLEMEKSLAICDLVIKPKMPAPLYRFDKVEAFWKAGRIAAEENLEELKVLLQ